MDETKMKFANALKELMYEKPLDKISVIEIANRAGVSRKAFYNHFADKYDLLNWYCYTQFIEIRSEAFAGGGWEAFRSFLEFFATDRRFFADALRDMGQNSFGQYFSDLLYEVVYDTAARGFRGTMRDEKWVGLAVAILVEDARVAIIIWLTESESPSVDKLFDLLVAATNAFCAMTCLDRAARNGGPICDHAVEILSESWSPDEVAVTKLPKPDDTNARRRKYARIIASCS